MERGQTTRVYGTVKRLMCEQGYGFVTGADGVDVFIHRSGSNSLQFDALREGDRVSYLEQASDKGVRGIDVVVVP